MILGNLFQQTYTLMDSAIVGRYVGEQALAAVGASYALTNIFICIAIGGGIGASVSRFWIGSKEFPQFTLGIYRCNLAFLKTDHGSFLQTPDHGSLKCWTWQDYLNIYFAGLPFLFLYNVFSSMFNALGKSSIPSYFLIFSSVFNVVLDMVLVTKANMGVTGVAWATLIAQGISAVLSFLVLLRELKRFPSGKTGIFSHTELLQMTRIALPSILQQSTVSIGMMLVQSFDQTARFRGIGWIFVGNAGGVHLHCAYGGVRQRSLLLHCSESGCRTGRTSGIRVSRHEPHGTLQCCPDLCLRGTAGTPAGRSVSGSRRHRNSVLREPVLPHLYGVVLLFIGFKMAVDGLLRGAGDMKMFTVANLVNLSIRVIVAVTMAPRFGIFMVWCAVPIGWFCNWLISFLEYRTGKWRRKQPAVSQ